MNDRELMKALMDLERLTDDEKAKMLELQGGTVWVEITKGECDELFKASSDHIEYAFAVEAKLKEKNT